MTQPTFPMPRINLNGTSKKQLREEYMEAYLALQRARDALAGITIHDRDYHMIDPQAGIRARNRRNVWLLALASIEEDLTHVVVQIDEESR